MSIVGIVNPAAGRGGAAQVWEKVRARLIGAVRTLQTERPWHAAELTRAAIKEGAQTIVAVGGDGTIHEVVNGFFEQDELISPGAVLALLPHGTGSDLSRMLRLPEDHEKAAAVIQSGARRSIDLLKVRYTEQGGASATRYSINVTSFGLGGIVASQVKRRSRLFGGKISFLLTTARTAIAYRGRTVTMCIDDGERIEARITNVAIGNGQYHGGGMRVCPRAAIEDGLLDVTLAEFLPPQELVRNLPLLYNGAIYSHPKVRFLRAKRLRADSKETVLIEIDGEPAGRLPIEASVVPGVIRVLAA